MDCSEIFLADFEDGEGNWVQGLSILADSGGCENGVNAEFARKSGFTIYTCEEYGMAAHATSATGGLISFNSFIETNMRVEEKIIKVKFYLMEGLPKPFLIGYPWMIKYGGVVDARKGMLAVEDLNITVKLERQKPGTSDHAVFANFGALQNFSQGVPSYWGTKPFHHTLTGKPAKASVSSLATGAQFVSKITGALGEETQSEWKGDLEQLLLEFSDVFDTSNTTPANVEPIQVGLKEGFENK